MDRFPIKLYVGHEVIKYGWRLIVIGMFRQEQGSVRAYIQPNETTHIGVGELAH